MRHLFRRPWVRRAGPDRFTLHLPEGVTAALHQVAGEVEGLLLSDDPAVRRVFPTAYPDDPDREAGYQALVRNELVERHQAGIELIESTLDADSVSADELTTWMTTVNALRLVLGTVLDVDEDHDLALDEDDPRFLSHQVFLALGLLLGDIIDALDSA